MPFTLTCLRKTCTWLTRYMLITWSKQTRRRKRKRQQTWMRKWCVFFFFRRPSSQMWLKCPILRGTERGATTPLSSSNAMRGYRAKNRASLECKRHTAPRALRTRKHFPRVWRKAQGSQHALFFGVPLKKKVVTVVTDHVSRAVTLDCTHLPLPHRALSPLFPSHGDIHCNPHLGGHFGRLARAKSPSQVFSPTIMSR